MLLSLVHGSKWHYCRNRDDGTTSIRTLTCTHLHTPLPQAKAVASYLDSASVHLPDARLFNESGRGYPDLSALAGQQNGYCVAYKGEYLKVGGEAAKKEGGGEGGRRRGLVKAQGSLWCTLFTSVSPSSLSFSFSSPSAPSSLSFSSSPFSSSIVFT